MALLTITSSNPDLSYVLAKNPNTILENQAPFEKSLRRGKVYGWFTKNELAGNLHDSFVLFFKDANTETSFGVQEEFEYLDVSRYCHPYTIIGMITQALNSATKGTGPSMDADKPGFLTKVNSTIKVPARVAKSIQQGLSAKTSEGFTQEVSFVELAKDIFQVTVITSTANEALNLLQVVCILACLEIDDIRIPLDKAALTKYAKILNKANAPFYLRHLLSTRAITTRTVFEELAPVLQQDSIKLVYGNTQTQRHDAIRKALQLSTASILIDIGCGELFHSRKLSSKYDNVIAVEADPGVYAGAVRLRSRYGLENVQVLNLAVTAENVKQDLTIVGADILLSEVLEHMEVVEALGLLSAILDVEKDTDDFPGLVVVTLPNHDFNQYFGIPEGEFRHPDHKWEPGYEEWSDIAVTLAAEYGWQVNVEPLGSTLNDSSMGIVTTFFQA